MIEWNAENVLDALNDFERKPEVTPVLDKYLERIAQNGEIVFPWGKLKPLLKKKLELVLDEFYETCPVETTAPVPNFETFNFDNLKKSILQAVESFTSAPFTIQRLCELVTNPLEHYNRTDKYMRGIEKNVLVVSTIDSRPGFFGDVSNANNPVVNGMINDSPQDGDVNGEHERNDESEVSSSNSKGQVYHVRLENFANVFPSAACIPSASNISSKQDVDKNYIGVFEFVEDKDIEFEAASEETAEEMQESDVKSKDEECMDTTEDEILPAEESTKSEEAVEETSEKSVSFQEIYESLDVEKDTSVDQFSEADVSVEVDSDLCDEDSASASEDSKNESDSSSALSDVASSQEETTGEQVCHQDDTVSQSDSAAVEEISQSDDSAAEDVKKPSSEDNADSKECKVDAKETNENMDHELSPSEESV